VKVAVPFEEGNYEGDSTYHWPPAYWTHISCRQTGDHGEYIQQKPDHNNGCEGGCIPQVEECDEGELPAGW
jgi:hypothetical protein